MHVVPVDLSEDTDSGLLLLIGGAGDSFEDTLIAHEALRELHSRHFGYVIGVLKPYAANFGTVAIDPHEWATKVFAKAFKSAASFEDRSDGDARRSSKLVRGWLGRIAENLARDELDGLRREQKRLPLEVLAEQSAEAIPADEDTGSTEESPLPRLSPKVLDRLRELMSELKPQDRDLLLTYAQHGYATEAGRELPPKIRKDLEDRTGYERSNIRQKWRRLSQRFQSELDPVRRS